MEGIIPAVDPVFFHFIIQQLGGNAKDPGSGRRLARGAGQGLVDHANFVVLPGFSKGRSFFGLGNHMGADRLNIV